jgi:Zn-dependent M28 family amino/carboxypeptidase
MIQQLASSITALPQDEDKMRHQGSRFCQTFLMMMAIPGLSTSLRAQQAPPHAEREIDAREMLRHIQVLASDEYEGRAPGSRGEEMTVAYLIDQFHRLNLKPGNPDGTYVQNVPLIGFKTKATGTIHMGDKTFDLKFPDDWVAVSRRAVPEVSVTGSELVFVGYGVVAPEYGWDDYKDVDVKGKTIVMLVNDPAVPDPNDPSKLDDSMFKGRAMTYYGRWTYKYEIATEKGAAAAILIHETGPAGYPYEVVVGSWGRENFDIPSPDKNANRPAIEAWIHTDKAKALLSACGQDFEALKKAAVRKDFKPVSLGAKADFSATNTLREIQSRNVVGKIEGSDPKLKDEFVVYTAHWDHLGKDDSLTGDQVYNGAADNASGVAALLEIGEGFARLNPTPRRSLLFLVVTAEEKGLLGAKYYATHPLYPLEKTVANINMDVTNLWGPTKDLTSVGFGSSTLDDVLVAIARSRGRAVRPDAEPEKGTYYRSDHFEFAKVGVPALDPKGGIDFVGKPADYGKRKREEYTQMDYHKVSDEVKSDWDLTGAVDDARILLNVGYAVANADGIPEWKPGTEFKAKREAMLKKSN